MPDRATLKNLSPEIRERDERERLTRQRVLLRVVTELWLVGVLRTLDDVEKPDDGVARGVKESTSGRGANEQQGIRRAPAPTSDPDRETDPFPLEILKGLFGFDYDCTNSPLAVLFARTYSYDILGIKSSSDDAARKEGVASGDESATASADDTPLTPEKVQQRFRTLLSKYIEKIKTYTQKSQKALSTQSRRNDEAYVKSGEIFEDRQTNFEKQSKAHDKVVANTQILCEILGIEMPELEDKEAVDASQGSGIGVVKTGEYLRGQGEGPGIWEDEDERRFYENLVDLKGKVPSILLDAGKKKKTEGEKEKDEPKRRDSGASASADSTPDTNAIDDQSSTIANKTVGAQVEALLMKLPELQTKEQVDDFALRFCFLNSKASRNRLLRAIVEIPKGRSDLLPLYARLVATLGQYLPDIVNGLVQHLDDEYRSLQRRKQKDFLGQVRMANIRYLAELTKFGLVPEHVIFHCFRVSLDDFSRMNIEIISTYLENCGRYLLRNPETSYRMASFLETLGRKKAATHLPQQERMILENAMYYVDPPQRPAIQQKERTPMELYVRKLIYLDMNKRNYPRILKTLRKLHWEKPEIVDILERIFSKPGKVKYGNIYLMVTLISSLNRYHQDFVVGIIDGLMENITLGLEINDFKFNQKRVAEVKYLGELYNSKLVDAALIFDTLYHITTFGHEGGNPVPGSYCALDQPDDFFRVRLACTLLDTCGTSFDRGASKHKLDFFLTLFQYYLLTKDPLPMDIEFMVNDTIALVRPKWKLVTDLPEAARLFREAIIANYQIEESAQPNEPEEEVDESDSDADEDALDEEAIPEADENEEESVSSEDEDAEALNENNDEAKLSDDDEGEIYVTRQDEERDPQEEADFDQAFEKMVSESLDSRKFERKAIFDVPLPMKRQPGTPSGILSRETTPIVEEPEVKADSPKPNTMAFSLMTKKGNRARTRTIDLPSDSSLAQALKNQQAAEREEQQRIKNLVLNYDLGSEEPAAGEYLLSKCFALFDRQPDRQRHFICTE
ncbi:hypothetical protein KEM56_002435 [Ascosphaera pollenicola]|nr:hypothetical protein KEM56_002435 [Ascosphaera pollenicola]